MHMHTTVTGHISSHDRISYYMQGNPPLAVSHPAGQQTPQGTAPQLSTSGAHHLPRENHQLGLLMQRAPGQQGHWGTWPCTHGRCPGEQQHRTIRCLLALGNTRLQVKLGSNSDTIGQYHSAQIVPRRRPGCTTPEPLSSSQGLLKWMHNCHYRRLMKAANPWPCCPWHLFTLTWYTQALLCVLNRQAHVHPLSFAVIYPHVPCQPAKHTRVHPQLPTCHTTGKVLLCILLHNVVSPAFSQHQLPVQWLNPYKVPSSTGIP